MTVNGGGEPNAWNIAHRTRCQSPTTQALPAPTSRARMRSIAVRMPLAASAGTVTPIATQWATRPDPEAHLYKRRSTSPGSIATAPARASTTAATITGTAVSQRSRPREQPRR